MRKLLALTAVTGGLSLAALIVPAAALACDTSFWNVGCQYYSVGESHSAYPGATPHNITIRLSAESAKWVPGKTREFVSTSSGSWVQNELHAGCRRHLAHVRGLQQLAGRLRELHIRKRDDLDQLRDAPLGLEKERP